MTIVMNDAGIEDIAGIKRFLKGSSGMKLVDRGEKYEWVAGVLKRFIYFELRKKDKTLVKEYMMRVTGFSDAQMGRLIADERLYGRIGLRTGLRNSFARIYTKQDIDLLAETDNLHERLSGPATKKLFQRAYEVYGDPRFERLKGISVAHLYNLRDSKPHKLRCVIIAKTRPTKVNAQVNAFYRDYLNEYLNFHRPCGFATTKVDKRGKEKKVYKTWQTPYERLQSLDGWEQYLKEGVTAQGLKAIASRRSDNDYARLMRAARNKLFSMIFRRQA